MHVYINALQAFRCTCTLMPFRLVKASVHCTRAEAIMACRGVVHQPPSLPYPAARSLATAQQQQPYDECDSLEKEKTSIIIVAVVAALSLRSSCSRRRSRRPACPPRETEDPMIRIFENLSGLTERTGSYGSTITRTRAKVHCLRRCGSWAETSPRHIRTYPPRATAASTVAEAAKVHITGGKQT